jgi:hypothetical protein
MPLSRVNPQFRRYMEHVNHNVVVVFYGKGGKKVNAENVSIECEDCNCVLTDENKYDEEEVHG